MFDSYLDHDIAVYGGYLADDVELLECSSGGIATALARQMISRGGYVAGVAYSEDFHSAQYEIAHTMEQINRFKGSKYVVADKKNIYSEVRDLLDEGQQVLFFGLPCVVAAMYSFLGRDYDNLLTCELVCHGHTRAQVHKEYIEYLESKYGSNVVAFNVRRKKGATVPWYLYAEFADGRVFEREFYRTEYGYAFSVLACPSCYKCRFKGNNRTGDMMIGDFRGATEKDAYYNKKGVSVIFVHTPKADDFIKQVPDIKLFDSDFQRGVAVNRMVIQSRKPHPDKEKFEKLLSEKGLIYAAHHTPNIGSRIKRVIANLIK